MKALVPTLCLIAVTAFAQHPDSLPLSRYGEPTWPNTKKTFQHVRLGNKVNDTSRYVWNTFGKVAETEEGGPIFGYQLQWNRATATYYFTINDSALKYFSNFRETEDSDAVYELKIPFTDKSSWQYKLTDTTTALMRAADTTVTVPAGAFEHCVVTVVQEGGETFTRTFAPDVGLIKMTTVGPEFSKLVDLVAIKK